MTHQLQDLNRITCTDSRFISSRNTPTGLTSGGLHTLNRILVVQICDNLRVIKRYEHVMFLRLAVPKNTAAALGEVGDL